MENTYIQRFQDPWIAITIRCSDGEMDKTYQKIKCTYVRISALNRWLAVIKIVVFRYFPLKIMLFIMQNTYIFRFWDLNRYCNSMHLCRNMHISGVNRWLAVLQSSVLTLFLRVHLWTSSSILPSKIWNIRTHRMLPPLPPVRLFRQKHGTQSIFHVFDAKQH